MTSLNDDSSFLVGMWSSMVQYQPRKDLQAAWTDFAMSTPVRLFTTSGTLLTMLRTSPVNFAAPTSPWPLDTIVIFLAWERGAATSEIGRAHV